MSRYFALPLASLVLTAIAFRPGAPAAEAPRMIFSEPREEEEFVPTPSSAKAPEGKPAAPPPMVFQPIFLLPAYEPLPRTEVVERIVYVPQPQPQPAITQITNNYFPIQVISAPAPAPAPAPYPEIYGTPVIVDAVAVCPPPHARQHHSTRPAADCPPPSPFKTIPFMPPVPRHR